MHTSSLSISGLLTPIGAKGCTRKVWKNGSKGLKRPAFRKWQRYRERGSQKADCKGSEGRWSGDLGLTLHFLRPEIWRRWARRIVRLRNSTGLMTTARIISPPSK